VHEVSGLAGWFSRAECTWAHRVYPFPAPAHANSGFDREDEWGYRALEPSRCCISSIALVLLKTGIVHPPESSSGGQVTVDYVQMATAQKLLLFWRKPARKCWWDGVDVDIARPGQPAHVVKLWARRVWTLELSLVRLRSDWPSTETHTCIQI